MKQTSRRLPGVGAERRLTLHPRTPRFAKGPSALPKRVCPAVTGDASLRSLQRVVGLSWNPGSPPTVGGARESGKRGMEAGAGAAQQQARHQPLPRPRGGSVHSTSSSVGSGWRAAATSRPQACGKHRRSDSAPSGRADPPRTEKTTAPAEWRRRLSVSGPELPIGCRAPAAGAGREFGRDESKCAGGRILRGALTGRPSCARRPGERKVNLADPFPLRF